MKKGEVRIDENRCFGCGYCVEFCPRNCLERGLNKVSPLGYAVAILASPDRCTACGICASICPRWAIQVVRLAEGEGDEGKRGKVALSPFDAPLSGCPGCQHPTVGRIVAEVLEESDLSRGSVAIDGIPCSISSAFGMEWGTPLFYGEKGPDVATEAKAASPDSLVVLVLGYWGMSDFSLDLNSLAGAMIRGEKITVILCNMPFYGPKEGRPVPSTESIGGRLEPATRISTEKGQRLIVGGYPLHVAELAATFKGVVYSARGSIASPKDYQTTKGYVKNALHGQKGKSGLSIVEIICACSDPAYSAPTESLRWVREEMTGEFPLGVFKDDLVEQS